MRQSHLLGAGVLALACLAATVAGRRALPRAAASVPEAPAPRARPRALDVTFLVTTDTHVGYLDDVIGGPAGQSVDEARDLEIRSMNEIAGRAFPPALGGRVAEPRGVLISGDLTEQGLPHEWARFEAIFGLTGKEGQLRYPVYEGGGNHDKWQGSHVAAGIARRHGGERYSWDWGALHLVCLGEAPDHADLAWLKADLDAAGPVRGIILYLHFPLAGPNSTGNSHTSGRYRWHGIDAYLEGSVKHAWHSFAVVHVTAERMTVASFNYDRQAFWWWHDKPIFGATAEAREWFADDRAIVGRPRG